MGYDVDYNELNKQFILYKNQLNTEIYYESRKLH